jgi:hypothetical protein
MEEFIEKMEEIGFYEIETDIVDGMVEFEGEYETCADCQIVAYTKIGEDIVNQVVALFPNQESWTSLSTEYYQLKELLIKKYGKPEEVVEKFSSPEFPKNNAAKFSKVLAGEFEFYSSFTPKNGIIELVIEGNDLDGAYVYIAYYDLLNLDSEE